MKILPCLAAAAFICAAACPALAISVTQSVTTTATPEQVWGVMGDFGGISTWLPPAASSPADHGNDVGSVRTITLKAPGDPTIVEKLTAYDAKKHSYSYDIEKVDPKVLPVTNYHSTIKVVHNKGGTKVVWKGEFDAPAGVQDKVSQKAVKGTYRAGLDQIKTLAEKQ